MKNTEFIEVGEIIRSQGIQGDLIVKLYHDIDPNIQVMYLDLTEGILNDQDSKVAYNVKNYNIIDHNLAIVRFNEVSERSQTNFLEGKKVYVINENFYHKNNYDISSSKLSGYKIYDYAEKKHLGKILGLKKVRIKYSEKTLIFVEYGNQTLPVPYEEDTIKSIDHNQKAIYINLPDEFLEVFLTKQ